MSNSVENGKKIRREMAVFGSVAVSSQSRIVYDYESLHTKGEPWNPLIKAPTPNLKTTASKMIVRASSKNHSITL